VTSSSTRLRTALAAILAALSLAATAGSGPLPRVELKAGAHAFDVEVATTPQQRKRGLKGRTRLAADAGMLFVFERPDRHCFWMKDTPLPLSIAFLADDGTVVGIADMRPKTLDRHCAPKPVRFALEVRQGGLRDKSVHAGAQFSGGPFGQSPSGSGHR
jgi:hypothetical protein